MGWIESPAHYLSVSTQAEAIAYRAFVNRWYESFADPNEAFAARLRSEVDADHYQALDELFVHHLLLRRYRDIRYEEGGVGRTSVCTRTVSASRRSKYFRSSSRTTGALRRGATFRLADAINERVRPTDGYMLNFKIEQADKEPAPTARCRVHPSSARAASASRDARVSAHPRDGRPANGYVLAPGRTYQHASSSP